MIRAHAVRTLDRPHAALAVVAAVTALVALQAAIAPLWDADLWWVLATGDELLRARAVPRVNGHSFTAPAHPWVMHEWLLGALYAALVRALGLPGIALARIAASLTAAACAWGIAAREARPLVAATALACALGLFGGRFESARPMGVAYALALLVTWAAFAPALRPRHAVAAALGTLLWTNAHGSFPLALAILLAAAVERPTERRRVALLALCAALTLANPYGLHMHDLVRRYLAGGADDAVAVVHARIVEWWPLHRAPLRMYSPAELAGFAAVALAWIITLRDKRFRARAALGLCLCAMALRHQRHLQLAGLLSVPLLAGVIAARRGEAPAPRARGSFALAALIALCAWGIVRARRPAPAWVNPSRDPEDFARLHAALPPTARLFATLPFAGFAVGLGGAPVFFDTRNDCYPRAVLREALDLDEGLLAPEAARRILRDRGATHAIAYCDGRAARSLSGWQRLRREGALCLWGE